MKRLDRFFFTPISPYPLAAFRILFGLTLLEGGLLLLPDLQRWFGPAGVLGPYAARAMLAGDRLNLLAWLPNGPGWLEAFFALHLAAALALTLGWRTRVAATIVFLTLTSLQHANPMIFNASDGLLRLEAFLLAFAPAGAAWSLDARRRGGTPAPIVPWAQRLIQVQLAAAYLNAAGWKLAGITWREGNAVYYVARVQEYVRWTPPYVFDHAWTVQMATWGTMGLELALGTLLWFKPLRYPLLAAGLAFHGVLDLTMNLPLFGQTFVLAYVLFLDPADLRRPARPAEPVAEAA